MSGLAARWEAALASRWAPAVAGLLTALAVWWVWTGAAGLPVMHDEWAYWMQGEQYARFRWSVAPPPLPEFFEQMYVLVTPVFAAKYPPGHAIAIAPGFALGTPLLMPLVLSGLAGGVLFALARRVATGGIAAMTWMFWLSTFGNLRFRASYFSEVTSALCWLVAWYALLEWRESGRRRPMLMLAIAIGWCAITRPYTAVALALPVAVVVIRDVLRTQRWATLGAGIAAGTVLVLVLPLWARGTTGSATTSPLALYTRQYLPFDLPGFHVDTTAPERTLPAEMERTRTFLREIKGQQATAPVARTVGSRVLFVLVDAFAGWRLPLVIAFAVGIATAGAAAWFALATGGLLMLAYGAQAHTVDWTVYYLEAFPAIAFATASGVRRLFADREKARSLAPLAAALIAVLMVRDVMRAREVVARISTVPRNFRSAVTRLPKRPNLIFVRYAPNRSTGLMHLALVANDGILDGAPSWIVHDRGADDRRLMDAAPDRTAYLYDERSGTFSEIAR